MQLEIELTQEQFKVSKISYNQFNSNLNSSLRYTLKGNSLMSMSKNNQLILYCVLYNDPPTSDLRLFKQSQPFEVRNKIQIHR